MLAQELKQGDQLFNIKDALVYTVISDARVMHSVETGRIVEVDIKHEVDGGQDIRCFNFDQRVPHVRP